jgi:hypothetical protein
MHGMNPNPSLQPRHKRKESEALRVSTESSALSCVQKD